MLFPTLSQPSQWVSRAGYQTARRQETTTSSGDPRHDRHRTDWAAAAAAAGGRLSQRGHERSRVLPAERPSSPGLDKSRCLRIGLPWPAEEGHLSPPLLSWQLCLFPQGWAYPAGAGAHAAWRPGMCALQEMGFVVPPCGGDLMIPQRREQRSYRQKDQMTKNPATHIIIRPGACGALLCAGLSVARHLGRITGQRHVQDGN